MNMEHWLANDSNPKYSEKMQSATFSSISGKRVAAGSTVRTVCAMGQSLDSRPAWSCMNDVVNKLSFISVLTDRMGLLLIQVYINPHNQVVTLRTAFNNPTFCLHSLFMCLIMIIIIIIMFINCSWVVTRCQWLFNTYTKHEIGLLLNLRREGYMRSM
jgi:hypothetical protein